MTSIKINYDALLTNSFGLALSAGRLKATITDPQGVHLTIQFKAWKRGDRRRNIPLYEADRVYIQIPTQGQFDGYQADRIGNIDMKTMTLWPDKSADPYRVEQAQKLLALAQGQEIEDTVQHPGSCMICGRELTDPESIEIGIGPECNKKATSSQHQEKVKGFIHETPPTPEPVQEDPNIIISNNQFRVDFGSAFSYDKLNILKAQTRGRSYDSMTKYWWVDKTPQNARTLLDLGLTLNEEAKAVAKDLVESFEEMPDAVIRYDETSNVFIIKFDFGPKFQDVLAAVKAIDGRKFNSVAKHWTVPAIPNSIPGLRKLASL